MQVRNFTVAFYCTCHCLDWGLFGSKDLPYHLSVHYNTCFDLKEGVEMEQLKDGVMGRNNGASVLLAECVI